MWLYLYQQSKKLSESVSKPKRGLIRHKQVPPTQAQGKHMLVAGFCRLCPLSAEIPRLWPERKVEKTAFESIGSEDLL